MAMMRKDQFFGKSDDDDERERNKWTLKKTNNVKKKKKKSHPFTQDTIVFHDWTHTNVVHALLVS